MIGCPASTGCTWTRRTASVSSPTSPGGTPGSARSWAMRSTSGRRTRGRRTRTCTRCWLMSPHWTCPAAFWSMRRETAKAAPRCIGSAMQGSTAGKHFRVATLDLAGPITRLDGEIRALAVEVRDLRQTTLDQRRGAWRRLVAGGRTGGIKVGDAGGRRHADAPSRSTKLRAVFAPIRNPYGWSVARSRARSPPRMLVML